MNKKIDYIAIIKEAVDITIKNKVLWWFGFLAIFSGSFFSFNYNFPNNSADNNFDEMAYMNMMRRASFYWNTYLEWIILGIVLLILIGIIIYAVGLIGRGALIDSIFRVIKKENFSFTSGFRKGLYFLGKIFSINFIFLGTFLILLFVLIFPVVRLVIFKSYGAAVLLGIVALLLLISISVLFFYLKRYAQLYLISSNLGVVESIKLAYDLFERNIKESFIFGLVLILINIILSVGVGVIFLGLLIPAIIAGSTVYKFNDGMTIAVLVTVAGIIFFGGIFFIGSILNVFFETVWVLFFYEMGNKKYELSELENKEINSELLNSQEPESMIS